MARRARFHEKGEGLALIELARQYPPMHAVREYVTNSLDEAIPGIPIDIAVMANPLDKRMIISDNGNGMTFAKLDSLDSCIGYGDKRNKWDKRGEKALGLLSFGSIGKRLHIITRPFDGKGNSAYFYQMWELNESKGQIPTTEPVELTRREVERDFYGNFPHGTRMIIDLVDPHTMENVLTQAALKEWLRKLYTPALRKGIANINLGRLDKRSRGLKAESLEPINYERDSSVLLLDEPDYKVAIKSEGEPSVLELLLFVDPEAAYDKVAVHSKDVLVYESLTELAEFGKSPVWTSGKVSGHINDNFNRLVLGRAGIDRTSNAFKAWYDAIKEIEEEIRPIVESKKKHGRRLKEEGQIKTAFDAFADIWKEFARPDLGEQFARGDGGELLPVDGAEPTKKRQTPGEPREPRGTPTGRPPGPGTFRHDPSGYQQRVVPRGGAPIGYPQPVDFNRTGEGHLRKKIVDLGGSPRMLLNETHEDYQIRVDAKNKTVFVRYLVDLIANESANYEVQMLEMQGRLVGDRTETISAILQKEEMFKFRALKRLGIK